jgi:hypothetical protein
LVKRKKAATVQAVMGEKSWIGSIVLGVTWFRSSRLDNAALKNLNFDIIRNTLPIGVLGSGLRKAGVRFTLGT